MITQLQMNMIEESLHVFESVQHERAALAPKLAWIYCELS